MEIRPIKLRDLIKVRDLEMDCIREYFSLILENRWEDLPEEWKDNLGASNRRSYQLYLGTGLSLVAEEDGEVMGFIFAQMLHDVNGIGSMAWIENMGVHRYFRRMGVGRTLLEEVIGMAKGMGADAVHSTIPTDNLPSIKLHENLGFVLDRRESALLDLNDLKAVPNRGPDCIAPLTRDAWGDLPEEWRNSIPGGEESIARYADSGCSFIARSGDSYIGYVFAQMLHHVNNAENLVWIEDIGVDAPYRRASIGFKLLRALAESAKASGATVMQTSIPTKNVPAIMLFKKIGFFIDRRESALLKLR